MSEEQLKELQEYNLEYLETQQSEEIFGGDYTSAVELKYAKKEIERLNNIIKTKDEGIKAFTEDLCEESAKIEKATEYIKKHTYHGKPKKLQNGIYERGILLIKSDFDIEELLEILDREEK